MFLKPQKQTSRKPSKAFTNNKMRNNYNNSGKNAVYLDHKRDAESLKTLTDAVIGDVLPIKTSEKYFIAKWGRDALHLTESRFVHFTNYVIHLSEKDLNKYRRKKEAEDDIIKEKLENKFEAYISNALTNKYKIPDKKSGRLTWFVNSDGSLISFDDSEFKNLVKKGDISFEQNTYEIKLIGKKTNRIEKKQK